MQETDEKMTDKELLQLEYRECVEHGRFMVGVRFNYFITFTTFFFVLIGAYNYVLIAEPKVFGVLKP